MNFMQLSFVFDSYNFSKKYLRIQLYKLCIFLLKRFVRQVRNFVKTINDKLSKQINANKLSGLFPYAHIAIERSGWTVSI